MFRVSFILISVILSGMFNSCSLAFDNFSPDYSDYEIRGKVVSEETGLPVQGVSVILFDAMTDDDELVMGYRLDSLEVSHDGTFVFLGRSYHGEPEYKYLKVSDLSLLESGAYKTKIFEVELSYEENPSSHSTRPEHDHYSVTDLVLALEPDESSEPSE